ncbi:MAG: OmpA family protein [Gemmatimonadaceae bacterium]|nr:OmpA family protein [Gemmatimonadaceae bacterium]
MIGNAMRFKLKKTLVGVAALSVLCPMASHADVTPGRWIFDGLGRSTRDGQGSTCVGAGGDTHAFDAPNCTQAQTESQQARQALAAEKKAAAEAAAATRAEARTRAQAALRSGQITGSVSRPDGARLIDGFGRDCVRDGSGIQLVGNCDPDPSVAAARAAVPVAAAAAPAAADVPVAPGSGLAPGSHGAYVTRSYGEVAGQELRDGFGRSCVKDGRWMPALATEECHPDLYSAWRNSQPAEVELARRVVSPPPEVKWPPEEPAPAPAPAPEAAAVAAAPEPSVTDNTLPVFPVTTYALPPDAGDADTLLADEEGEALADGDDDGAPLALLAGTDEDDTAADTLDEEDEDTVAAFDDDNDDDDDGDGNDDEMAAFGGDDVMRDDENMALAAAGDDDDYDDDADHDDGDEEDDLADASDSGAMEADDSLAVAALADTDDEPDDDDAVFADDEDDVTEASDSGVMEADDSGAVAALADTGDASDEDDAVFADDDEPVMAAEDPEDDTGYRVAEADLAPRIAGKAPEVVRSAAAPAPVAAPMAEAEQLADFPVTRYEYDASATTADTGTSALAAAPEEQEPLADTPAEPAPTAKVSPPEDTPAVAAATAQPAEPKASAEVASPEVACPPVTIQLEGARFDFDKWVLRPQAKEKLDDVAAKLKSHQCEAIDIIGHTDRIGTAKYNQRLSERRANAARDYLIKHHGIEADRVTATGKGESELITQASDCRGKRKKALIACYGPDRRIEVKVRK